MSAPSLLRHLTPYHKVRITTASLQSCHEGYVGGVACTVFGTHVVAAQYAVSFPGLILPPKGDRKVSGQEAERLALRLQKAHLSKDRLHRHSGEAHLSPTAPSSFRPLHPTVPAGRLPAASHSPHRPLRVSAATCRPHVALPPPAQP